MPRVALSGLGLIMALAWASASVAQSPDATALQTEISNSVLQRVVAVREASDLREREAVLLVRHVVEIEENHQLCFVSDAALAGIASLLADRKSADEATATLARFGARAQFAVPQIEALLAEIEPEEARLRADLPFSTGPSWPGEQIRRALRHIESGQPLRVPSRFSRPRDLSHLQTCPEEQPSVTAVTTALRESFSPPTLKRATE